MIFLHVVYLTGGVDSRTKTKWSAFASARSIEEPLRQIVENAGEGAAVVLNQVKGGKGGR